MKDHREIEERMGGVRVVRGTPAPLTTMFLIGLDHRRDRVTAWVAGIVASIIDGGPLEPHLMRGHVEWACHQALVRMGYG